MDDSIITNNNPPPSLLSTGYQATLSIVPKLSSAMSIIALIYAIQFITRSPQRMRILSNRLFLGMYIADLARCLTFFAGTWMVPIVGTGTGTFNVNANANGNTFMATGNGCTCAIQAFVSQLGLVVPLYAVACSVYFVLAIRNNFNINMYRWAEKWCHVCPIFVGLFLAILMIVYKNYGADATRCWITPTPIKCLNKEYFLSNAECSQFVQQNTLTQTAQVTHRSLMISTWIFENSLCILSIFLLLCTLITGLATEARKRHNNESLRGKRKYLDKARQRKALFFLSQILTNFLSVVLCFGTYHIARYSNQFFTLKASFAFLLLGTVLNTLFGVIHVLIFLNVKLARNEALTLETSNFSIRKSVRSKESFNLVTGGYVPKKRFCPPKGDFGGIYLGDEDDEIGDEALDDFDICCDDFNAGTSLTIGSVGEDYDLPPSPGPMLHDLSSPGRTNVM